MSNARNVVNQIVDDIVQDATKTLNNVNNFNKKTNCFYLKKSIDI